MKALEFLTLNLLAMTRFLRLSFGVSFGIFFGPWPASRPIGRTVLGLFSILFLALTWTNAQAQVSWLFRAPKDLSEVDRVIGEKFPSVAHTTTQELVKQLSQAEPPLLLDVRAAAEFEVSHLPGAIRVSDALSAQAEIAKARTTQPQRAVVLYCSVGYRSAELAAQLQKLPDKGYSQNLYNLRGSLFQWANEGRSVVAIRNGAQSPASLVHPYNQKWSGLLLPNLRAPL